MKLKIHETFSEYLTDCDLEFDRWYDSLAPVHRAMVKGVWEDGRGRDPTTLNERLCALLQKIKPTRYRIFGNSILEMPSGDIFNPQENTNHALHFAKLLGLFKEGYVLKGDVLGNYAVTDTFGTRFGEGATIEEVVLKAILEIDRLKERLGRIGMTAQIKSKENDVERS